MPGYYSNIELGEEGSNNGIVLQSSKLNYKRSLKVLLCLAETVSSEEGWGIPLIQVKAYFLHLFLPIIQIFEYKWYKKLKIIIKTTSLDDFIYLLR